MTTFDILNQTFNQSGKAFSPFNTSASEGAARATVPISGAESYDLPTSATALTGSRVNYPEPGQNSNWTIGTTAVSQVYRIAVTTDFPAYDPRLKQEESYYLKDIDNNGKWTTADVIVRADGTVDSKHRILNTLTYRDGSTQTETIVDVRFGPNGFAPWTIAGSLDYPATFSTVNDTLATYSSVVVYQRHYTDTPSFSFWQGKRVQAIVGMRYYTERLNSTSDKLISSMIVFEKAVTYFESTGGDFLNSYSALFLPDLSSAPRQSTLAQSVIRQEIQYGYNGATQTVNYNDATRDTRTRTRVVNIPNQIDTYITRIQNEAAQIANAYDTIWVPSAEDPAVYNLGTAPLVNVKVTNTTVASGDFSPLAVTADNPSGAVGALYVSVLDGTPVSVVVQQDIPGDVTGEKDLKQFNGKQGMIIPAPVPANAYSFNNAGTVQAWVKVKKATSFGGIVHGGIKSDFSDELWTLQFWGSNNVPAFGLVAQKPYAYDMVLSTEALKLGLWYHVAATWDLAGNTMNLYVNGVNRGSAAFKNVKTTSTFAPIAPDTFVPVVVGSQFYDGKKVLPGYYGTSGDINGVLIENRSWSAQEIRDFYDLNKDKTAAW